MEVRKINQEKLQFLVLQGVGYILLGISLFLWAKNSKGFTKYFSIFFGVLFIIWGVFDLVYTIYLLNHKPVQIGGVELLGSDIVYT